MKLSLPPEEKKLIFESFPDLLEYLDSRLNPKSYSCRIRRGLRSPPNRSRDTLTGEARLKGPGRTTRSDGLIVVVHAAISLLSPAAIPSIDHLHFVSVLHFLGSQISASFPPFPL